jgi:hypothetical protein
MTHHIIIVRRDIIELFYQLFCANIENFFYSCCFSSKKKHFNAIFIKRDDIATISITQKNISKKRRKTFGGIEKNSLSLQANY